MLEKYSRRACFHDLQRDCIPHARGDKKHLGLDAAPGKFCQQRGALLVAKVVVEQDDIGRRLRTCGDGLGHGRALASQVEVRSGFQKPAQALTEEAMVVDDENADIAHDQCSSVEGAGVRRTMKRAPSRRGW